MHSTNQPPSVFLDSTLQKWVWIELTGFDRSREDFGIPSFLERCGFIPEGFSLLLYWTGFALNHEGMQAERPLSICEDSYGGHPYCPERARQDWTNWELRALIARLRALGSKVYLSYFNMSSYVEDDGTQVVCPFYRQNPDLLETNRAGQPRGGTHMLKHCADGSWYEDILQEKTVEVLADYGFDGLQIADGISSPRIALQEGDYSEDMVGQFAEHTGITLPRETPSIADWIWQNERGAWIRFHTWRWDVFYRKFLGRLQAAGKEAIFNSAWTRDPFEAMYRYGVDYRRVRESGVCGCMVEDTSSGLAILSERDNGYLMNDAQRRRVHFEFLTTLMCNRAAMPNLRITPLAGIHDTMEQWGVLEHMPTAMTRNVIHNLNTFIQTPQGLKPITDGPFFCLSDSLTASDWAFIRRQWEVGVTRSPQRTAGVTLLWSDARVDAELDAFIATRRTPTHRLASELLYACAPIHAIVRAEDLAFAQGPLLIINFDLLPDRERHAIRTYQGGRVFLMGSQAAIPEGFTALVRESNRFADAWLAVNLADSATVTIENNADDAFDPRISMDPCNALWTHPLTFQPLSEAFFQACADALTLETGAPELTARWPDGTRQRMCKSVCVFTGENTCRVFLSNDDYYYNHATLDMHRDIASIRCLTKYDGYAVEHSGSRFTARIPGRGMEAFAITLK